MEIYHPLTVLTTDSQTKIKIRKLRFGKGLNSNRLKTVPKYPTGSKKILVWYSDGINNKVIRRSRVQTLLSITGKWPDPISLSRFHFSMPQPPHINTSYYRSFQTWPDSIRAWQVPYANSPQLSTH